MPKRRTNEEFEKIANELYNNKYEFPDHDYNGSQGLIYPVCPIHDRFETTPNRLLSGHGCPKCGAIRGGDKLRKTKEQFIIDARNVHGDKYDYSLVEYINSETNVMIICPKHKPFPQSPNSHLGGHGCPDCANAVVSEALKYTREEYIELANKKHNKFYSYDNLVYVTGIVEGIITCPIHGDFPQMPALHLHGGGCPSCAGVKKLIQEDFERRGNEIHNNFYNYSEFIYVNTRTKGTIICPLHGSFPQTPNQHIYAKKGCKKCGIEKSINTIIEKYGEIYYKLVPKHNLSSIIHIDNISEKLNIFIQHALNGGEKKFQRYWVDGYISDYNICIEWMENHHNEKKHEEKDLKKKQFLEEKFNCRMIYIWEKEFLKDVDNQLNIVVNKINQIINN